MITSSNDTTYNTDTTIEELLFGKVFSVRTVNVLSSHGISTLGELVEAYPDPDRLLSLRNFGKKCLDEVKKAMEKISPAADDILSGTERGVAQRQAVNNVTSDGLTKEGGQRLKEIITDEYAALTGEGDELSEYIRRIFLTAVGLHRAVSDGGDRLLDAYRGVNKRGSREQTIELRRRYRHFIESVMMRMEWCGMRETAPYAAYRHALEMLAANMERFTPRDVFDSCMTDVQRTYVRERYADHVAQLCVRSANFLAKNIPRIEDMMAYVGREPESFRQIVPHASMTKSLADMQQLAQKLEREIEDISKMADDDILKVLIADHHPFLNNREKEMVFFHIKTYGYEPRFFLLYHYMRTSIRRSDRIYSLSCGVVDGIRHSRREVAEWPGIGLTQERVRQICEDKTKLKVASTEYVTSPEWARYSALTEQPFINEKTPEYFEIKQRESLNFGFNVFAGLLAIVKDYVVVDVDGHVLLLAKSLAEDIDIGYYAGKVKQLCNGRRTEDRMVPIELITGDTGAVNGLVTDIVKHIATVIYGLGISGGDTLIVPRNSIDVAKELHNILSDRGCPMSVTELFEAFKERYPEHKYTKAEQIKPSLRAAEHVRPIGKTSRYTLDTWEGVYHGTIRDILVETLSSADEPVPIDKLLAKVAEHYPNTTAASVASSLCCKRFTRFEGECYGLASKQYDSRFKVKRRRSETIFDEHLQRLKEYIKANGRLPKSTGTKYERSLYVWVYNVRRGVIKCSRQQWQTVNRLTAPFIKRRRNG